MEARLRSVAVGLGSGGELDSEDIIPVSKWWSKERERDGSAQMDVL